MVSPKPLFSVVVPTFNRKALLQQCLATIANQTFFSYEVIVVDDGSTDGTWSQLEALSSDRVRVFRTANGGPGAARNLAAKHARGEYLAFLDSDDLWFPWTLQTYADVIALENGPSFIAGRPFRFDQSQMCEGLEKSDLRYAKFQDYLASGDQWRWYGLSSFVVHRACFEVAGGLTSHRINGEDADLAMRLGTAPGFVEIQAPYCFGYREHGCNITHQLEKTVAGIRHWLLQEEQGEYPGGSARRLERLRILSTHVRSNSFNCAKAGYATEAWEFYRRTLRWSIELRKWRYLLSFPAYFVGCELKNWMQRGLNSLRWRDSIACRKQA